MMRRAPSNARILAEYVYAALCALIIVLAALHALHSTCPATPTVLP